MERRMFLRTGLASLALASTSNPEAAVQRTQTGDSGGVSLGSAEMGASQYDAPEDDLPTMYAPRLIATIDSADSMVVWRETDDPKGDVVLGFKLYDRSPRVIRRVHVPLSNLRTGLYVRGVPYRVRIDASVGHVGVRSTMVFAQRVRVIVYTDEWDGDGEGAMGPLWIANTVIVARPAV